MEKIKRSLRALEKKVLPKKEKSTFFKDPVESVAIHLGKWLDTAKPQDVVDMALYGGLAYLSLEAGNFDPRAALIGPIGLKLATTMGGTPPVSQIAGLSILAVLGLVKLGVLDVPSNIKEETARLIGSKVAPFPFETERIWMLP